MTKPETRPRRHLKSLIRERKLMESIGHKLMMELPGEPLPYSIKQQIGMRQRPSSYFRNRKYASLIKCIFPSLRVNNQPAVLFVRFYVTPFTGSDVTKEQLKSESVPATKAFEISDYVLSFIEVLYRNVIDTYKQIVKIDADKFYSNHPRTVFKFMHWNSYVKNHNINPFYTEGKGKCKNGQEVYIQPFTAWNATNPTLCEKLIATVGGESFVGCSARDCPLQDAHTKDDSPTPTPVFPQCTACKTT